MASLIPAAPAELDEPACAPTSGAAGAVTSRSALVPAGNQNASATLVPTDEKHAEVPVVGKNDWRREKFETSSWNSEPASAAASAPVVFPYSFVKMIDIGSAETKQRFQVPLVIGVDCRRRPVVIAALMTELVTELNVQLVHAGVQLRKISTRAAKKGVANAIQYMLSFEELELVAPGAASQVLVGILEWMNVYWLPDDILSFRQDGYLEFNLGNWVHSGNPHVKMCLPDNPFDQVCKHVFDWTPSRLDAGHEFLKLGNPFTKDVCSVPCRVFSLVDVDRTLVVPLTVHGSWPDQLRSLLNALEVMKQNGFDGDCCCTFLPDKSSLSAAPSNTLNGASFDLHTYLGLPSAVSPSSSTRRQITNHPGMQGAAVGRCAVDINLGGDLLRMTVNWRICRALQS